MTKPKNQDTHLKRGSGTNKAAVTHAASMQILETTRLALTSKMERLKAMRLEAEGLALSAEPVVGKGQATKKVT